MRGVEMGLWIWMRMRRRARRIRRLRKDRVDRTIKKKIVSTWYIREQRVRKRIDMDIITQILMAEWKQ